MTPTAGIAANIFVIHVAESCRLQTFNEDELERIAQQSFAAARALLRVQDAEYAAMLEAEQAASIARQAAAEEAARATAAEAEEARNDQPSSDYAEYTEGGYPEGVSAKERAAMASWAPGEAEPGSLASYKPTRDSAERDGM
jgi:hypothetical protein